MKNYKSVIDSGDCYLTDTISVLAGKNESDKNTEISMTFVLGKDTVKATSDIELEVIKTFPDPYL